MPRSPPPSKLCAEDYAFSKLASFSAYMYPDLVPARHHHYLCAQLEAVERGEIRRLMIFLPPGSAKSHYANVCFSAWFVGRNPASSLLVCSASSELATQWGRRVRNLVADPAYRGIFRAGLSGDNAAADRWATDHGGSYYAAGVGSNIVGRRADLAVLDDPVADRDHAESPVEREALWQWYRWDLWTRLKPDARVVLIMTRWNDDDLAGRLLKDAEEGGEPWTVISIPALALEGDPLGRKPGDPLWPEWFSSQQFAEAQRDPRRWSALYQQQPTADEGLFFRRADFRWYDALPQHLRLFGSSDFAVTAEGGDWTEHGVWGIDPQGNIYAVDWWFGQTSSDQWIESLLDLMQRHKTLMWFGEAGVIRRSVEPFLTRRQRERKVFGKVEWLPSIRDKPTRARGFQSRVAMGTVYLPTASPWAERLLDQLLRFPAGVHDDAVDVCSLIGLALDQAHPALVAAAPSVAPRSKWDRAFDKTGTVADWKVA